MKTLLIILILSCYSPADDYKAILDKLSVKHQACLDSGINTLGCSKQYYFEMDSMLNVVYNEYRAALSKDEKETLKQEQLNWLKKRDEFFEKENEDYQSKIESGLWGPDMYMVVYDNDAEFVKERTLELIALMKN